MEQHTDPKSPISAKSSRTLTLCPSLTRRSVRGLWRICRKQKKVKHLRKTENMLFALWNIRVIKSANKAGKNFGVLEYMWSVQVLQWDSKHFCCLSVGFNVWFGWNRRRQTFLWVLQLGLVQRSNSCAVFQVTYLHCSTLLPLGLRPNLYFWAFFIFFGFFHSLKNTK